MYSTLSFLRVAKINIQHHLWMNVVYLVLNLSNFCTRESLVLSLFSFSFCTVNVLTCFIICKWWRIKNLKWHRTTTEIAKITVESREAKKQSEDKMKNARKRETRYIDSNYCLKRKWKMPTTTTKKEEKNRRERERNEIRQKNEWKCEAKWVGRWCKVLECRTYTFGVYISIIHPRAIHKIRGFEKENVML